MDNNNSGRNEIKPDDAILDILIKVCRMLDASFEEISGFALEKAIELTGSESGFLGFFDENESFYVYTWAGKVMEDCKIEDKSFMKCGFFREQILDLRGPLIENEYKIESYPEDHIRIYRYMVVPVFDGDKIVAMAALANKKEYYNDRDIKCVTVIADCVWKKYYRTILEESLQKKEEKLKLAFENSVDAIFWADGNTGIVINCNRAAERLMEKTKAEIIGKPQTFLHPPDKREYYSEMFKKHISVNGFWGDEAEIVTKSGVIKKVSIVASISKFNDRFIIQGIFRDITEQKKNNRISERKRRKIQGCC